MKRHLLSCWVAWCAATAWSFGQDSPPEDRVVEIAADPPKLKLAGAEASYTLLVEGRTNDGKVLDLTRLAKFRSENPTIVVVAPGGTVESRGDGDSAIVVEVVGKQLTVPVHVEESRSSRALNFANDIVPLLSRFGCNSSGCHGKAEGQNGFKLSVFGFDPKADYDALTKEGRGRRVFPAAPERSLLLAKVSGGLPHGGGVRIRTGTPEFRTLTRWIASGLPIGAASDPQVVSIAVHPRERLLDFAAQQQLRVIARFSDGRDVDVTPLARFQTNSEGLASVDESGLVTVGQTPGQVAIMASFMGAVDVFQSLIPRPGPAATPNTVPEANFIDRLVHEKLRKLNLRPSPPAEDSDFLRRAYLDLIGVLPTAFEARRFLTDNAPDKRQRLVEDLLARPEYADYWALWWADLLRVDRRTLGHKPAYEYYRWIHERVAAHTPLNQFARELLTAEGPVAEMPAANFYQVAKQPGEMASSLAQIFLGVRIACAECHHHPYDRWSQTDYYGMTAFFAPLGRKKTARGEVLFASGDPQTKHPRTGETIFAHALGTPQPAASPAGDRRAILADWLASPENPWFARNLANRIWARMMGRGLVEPVDDIRDTNPPTNPQLLDALAAHLIENNFDVRAMLRAITASQAYQRSSQTNETNASDEQNYSRALFKRMPAEVLFDAVCQSTGVEEKFDGVASGYRAVQLWDSQVKHYFLKLFGRPERATACECERNVEASVAQVLHLMNSPQIQAKISHEAGQVARIVREHEADGPLVEELYLTFYSRLPTSAERDAAIDYLKKSPAGRRAAAEDLAWSLLNSLEFVFVK